MTQTTNNTKTNNNIKVVAPQTTQKVINNIVNNFVKKYAIYNSNKALKLVANKIFNGFEIKTTSTSDFDFDIMCKIKSADFLQLNELTLVDLSKNITCNVNVFNEIYTNDFLQVLSKIDTNTQKMLFAKSICYNLKLSSGLVNTLKYYKDNNIKINATEICTKQKISLYQVFKDYATIIIDYVNKATKTNNK